MQIYDYRSGSKKLENHFLHIHVILFICISNNSNKKIELREAKGINILEPGTELGASNIVTQVVIALANHLELTH